MSSTAPGLLATGPWRPEQVRSTWREEAFEPAPAVTEAADVAIQALKDRGSPSHDGPSARLAGYSITEDGLSLDLQPARWALRLVGEGDPVAAHCVVRDADGHWLAGRRAAWVATWAGRWALGAGGAVDLGEDPTETLGREMEEEWGVAPEALSVEALVRVPTGLVMLVGLARVAANTQVTRDHEHDAHAWWPADVEDWPEEADQPLRLMASMLAHR